MFGLLKGLFVKGLRKVLKAGVVYFFEGLGVVEGSGQSFRWDTVVYWITSSDPGLRGFGSTCIDLTQAYVTRTSTYWLVPADTTTATTMPYYFYYQMYCHGV